MPSSYGSYGDGYGAASNYNTLYDSANEQRRGPWEPRRGLAGVRLGGRVLPVQAQAPASLVVRGFTSHS